MDQAHLDAALVAYSGLVEGLPPTRLSDVVKVQTGLMLYNALQHLVRHMDENPYSGLTGDLQVLGAFVRHTAALTPVFPAAASEAPAVAQGTGDLIGRTSALYEAAWMTYTDATYDHSMKLFEERLAANGFDRRFFADKVCFDGGCATGRFALTMASLGAARVVGADISGDMLEFARGQAKRKGLTNVEFAQCDVTDLSRWATGSFDFVVSNGVLHHAAETERGIREHLRITKSGGTYWLYLYGDGGVYWQVFDVLKKLQAPVGYDRAKQLLALFGCREGIIYSYLDNVFAPMRKYYRSSQVVRILDGTAPFTYAKLKGTSTIDDTTMVLASRYGREIFGPEGEVRLRLDKG